jgi:hypothetical protein
MKVFFAYTCLLFLISCGQNKNKNKITSTDTIVGTVPTVPVNNNMEATPDLTNRYYISFQAFTDSTYFDPSNFRIAVVPVDSLGQKEIDWSEMKKGNSVESEKEFETELMNCIDGKDKNSETPAITVKKAGYCEREGYTDHSGMENYPWLYYGAFVKDNKLVIAELFTSFSKCKMETKKEKEECEAENEKQRKSIRSFMDNLVKTIDIKSK